LSSGLGSVTVVLPYLPHADNTLSGVAPGTFDEMEHGPPYGNQRKKQMFDTGKFVFEMLSIFYVRLQIPVLTVAIYTSAAAVVAPRPSEIYRLFFNILRKDGVFYSESFQDWQATPSSSSRRTKAGVGIKLLVAFLSANLCASCIASWLFTGDPL